MEELKACPICGSVALKSYMTTKDFFLTQEEFSISECSDCHFKFTNPRPEPEQLGKYYKSEEYISHSNNKKGFVNGIYQAVRQYTLAKKFQAITKIKKEGKILDIGCATGELLNFFQQNKWETLGIEPDPDARNLAETNYNLDVREEEDIANLEDKSFDVITMWHVLEHVANLQERAERLSQLVKDDGLVVIAVPNIDSWDAKHYGDKWAAIDVPRHLYHFSQKNMETLMQQHGFKLIKTKPMVFDSFYVSLLSEKYKNGKPSLIKAFINGLRSNIWANANQQNFSSVTYFFTK
ncbi:MAG: class I SAM-dependent methyltransferase [Hyphomicrobiales bacterium]